MLQIWAEDGRPLLRLGDRINRRLGFVDVAADSTGYIDVPKFSEGVPFHTVTSLGSGDADFLARVTIVGNRLSWEYAGRGYGTPQPSRITYGLY
jgi:hypothetical protein